MFRNWWWRRLTNFRLSVTQTAFMLLHSFLHQTTKNDYFFRPQFPTLTYFWLNWLLHGWLLLNNERKNTLKSGELCVWLLFGFTLFLVGYTMDTMYFEMLWKDNVKDTVEISDDLQMPQFTLNHRDLKDCSTNYTSGEAPYVLPQ
jgi:hypothetical protein